jgi:hypothetical protein
LFCALHYTDNVERITVQPQDSVSQTGTGSFQASTRPDDLPEEVLWNIHDCVTFGHANEKNKSRPPMEKCIRYADGRQITTADYSSIKKYARHLILTLLNPKNLLAPQDPKAKTMAKTKLYYKQFHYDVYSSAVSKLEDNFSILTLCSNSWKADHVLAASLLSSLAKKTKLRQSFQVDNNSDSDPTSKATQKRPLSEGEDAPLANKKVRSDLNAGSTNDTSDLDEPSHSKSEHTKGRQGSGSSSKKGKTTTNSNQATSSKAVIPIAGIGSVALTTATVKAAGSTVEAASAIVALTTPAFAPAAASTPSPHTSTYIDVGFIEVNPSGKFFFCF